jgi:phosphopantothenoylcysteine decarboxylase/phosphopantothenate--cysteine ligase
MTNLRGRNLVVGVSGSIAAYKAADLASRLVKLEATVDVLMTQSATEFVTPLTFQALTGRPVIGDMFSHGSETAEAHVAIARRADAIVLAPASASMLARLAHGLADDIVSLTVLATLAPVLIVPAMDNQMYEAPITQQNVQALRDRGYAFVGPESGRLASGQTGVGRLSEPETIVEALRHLLGRRGDLAGRKIVVSAGGTREPLDPVRYIGNHSSGRMGYALAEAARDRGADVVLVSAPVALTVPYGVRRVSVGTTEEMRDAILKETAGCHALIMAAAPADFRPAAVAEGKLAREGEGDAASAGFALELTPTADIVAAVAAERRPDQTVVGFAAEHGDGAVERGRAKLSRKGLDAVVVNDISRPDIGFDSADNEVTIVLPDGERDVGRRPKAEVAAAILDEVEALRARGTVEAGNER